MIHFTIRAVDQLDTSDIDKIEIQNKAKICACNPS